MTNPPTDILYVITDLRRGGVPLHLYRLATAMRGRGLQPAVVCLTAPDVVASMLRDAGVPVSCCEGRGGWDFRVVPRLAGMIRRSRPGVVHAMLFHANVAARLAARLARFPARNVICEIQTVEVHKRWHLTANRWTDRLCRLTIGNSPSVIEHLAQTGRIPRERLHLIRGGIDPAQIKFGPDGNEGGTIAGPSTCPALSTCPTLPPSAEVLLWVGRLDLVKGLIYLLDAFAVVVERRLKTGASPQLLLAGDGPLHDELQRLMDRLGLQDRVHMLGARDDVPDLLQSADVFVFPSLTEGLPNALLEAMAAARPIVATDVPGCRDLIDHERTGLLVPPADATALAAAILRLLEDCALARRLAWRAAEEVTRCWHFDQTLDAYVTLYQTLLHPRQAALNHSTSSMG